jgi:hypothetical protein
MKRIAFLTCIGTLALALTAWGAPKGKTADRSARDGEARSAKWYQAKPEATWPAAPSQPEHREVFLLRDLLSV